MLTTLKQDDKGWWVDVTENEDGKVDVSVGPTQDKQLAQRWERHILREHAMWEHMIRTQSIRLFDTCMRKLRYETSTFSSKTLASHDAWMRHHPLRTPLKLGERMMTIDMDKEPRHE